MESLQARGEDPYTTKVTCALLDPPDMAEMERRWNNALANFPNLFQVLRVEEGVWSQEIREDAVLPLKHWEIESHEGIWDFHETAHLHKFDLAAGEPLVVFNIFQKEDKCLGFSLVTHHVLYDAVGVSMLVVYLLEREQPPVPKGLNNGDYACWFRDQDWSEARAFWTNYMRDFDQVGTLPMLRARGETGGSLRGRGMRTVDLSPHTAVALNKLVKETKVTMATLAYSAWAVVLGRYTGQPDVAFGAPRSCRKGGMKGLETMVGITLNTVPLRAMITFNKTVGRLLADIRQDWIDFRPHERLSLSEIMSLAGGRATLQTTCNFHYGVGTMIRRFIEDPISEIEVHALAEPTNPLSMAMLVFEDKVQLSLSYDLELVRTVQAGRMLDCLLMVVEAMAQQGKDARLGELPAMSPQEAERTLSVWNQTGKSYGSPVPVHQLFESGVAAWGDAIALDFEGEYLKYRELNDGADRLAARLSALGAGTGDLVALCLPRSHFMVVAILGTVKAGCAYLPLATDTPRARLDNILSDAAPRAAVTLAEFSAPFEAGGIPVLALDQLDEKEPLPDYRPPKITPEGLAYVIYTSGSTGVPKGVMCTHAGLFNRLQWMQQTFLLTPQDRVLQKTAYTFDVSVWEFFWPLLFGGRLVIALPEGHKDPVYLVETIRRAGVTISHFVPSMLTLFLKAPEVETLTRLRLVLCSGEALTADQVSVFYDRCTASLHNLYGPTEAAIDVTHQPCESGMAEVPIGKPIGNTRVYVLNTEMQPVPVGVPGELFLAGVQLARGYLNRPGLTAERFVIPPAHLNETSRLYRTGDLVRRLEDGELAYLGRLDNQVKIRGFRIELGEIEAALGRFAGVSQVAVTLQRDHRNDAYLAAYLVLENSPAEPERNEIKRFLGETLPAYMVPSVYIFLPEMPLTSSGKLNRRALPDPRAQFDSSRREGDIPQPGMESLVAELFCSYLKVETCTRNEHFFELGGHSLTAAHMAMELQQRLGSDISPNMITRHPILKDLAEVLTLATLQNTSDRLNLEPQQRPKDVPASRSQEWMWLLHQLEEGRNTYTIPLGYRFEGPLNLDVLKLSLNRMVTRHEMMRTTFYTREGKVYQNIQETGSPALDVRDCNKEEVEELWLEGLSRSFDLQKGPLWRVYLARVSDQLHYLFVMVHHIACDGYGLQYFFFELWEHYRQGLTGGKTRGAMPKIQPADLAIWERQRMDRTRTRELRDYWQKRLAGAETGINLPLVRPRKKHRRGEGASIFTQFSPGLRRSVDDLCKKLRVTPFSLMLAAWFVLMQRYSGRNDLVVSVTFAGRDHRETQKLIAALLNVLPVRYEVADGIHFGGMCKEVHEMLIEDRAHADLSPQQLMQMMESRGNETSRFLSPVLFDLKMAESEEVQIGSLCITPEHRPMFTAKMDMLISLRLGASDMDAYLEYDHSLFDRAAMEGLMDCYQTLLGRLIRFQAVAVSRLSLLSAKQRLLLQRWGTGKEAPVPENLFQMFADAAQKYPQAVALEEGDEELTYGELLEQAAALGVSLSVKGMGPGENVAIYCRRGMDRVTALLAVLWTGAAYVPIDTAYPASRVQAIVEDARISRVLVSRDDSQPFPVERCHCLPVHRGESDWSRDYPEPYHPGPMAPAYIVFTSGSTGRPKGVVISHRGACNFVSGFTAAAQMTAGGRMIQLASPGFDAFFLEWGLALTSGSTLVTAPREYLVPGKPLNRFLRLERISHILLPPSIGAVTPAENLPNLRTIFFGGEALAPDIAARWLPGRRCFNAYGPSEVSVATCLYRLPREPGDTMPIGGPLANLRIHVLDGDGQPVPPGQPGELCVGGAGVAQGYVGRPGLTAERFIPEPGQSGAVMYRTGDRVRWGNNGSLVFIGRLDNQVKIRGFRVEPDEVARVLMDYPEVRNAVVTCKEIPGRGTVLIAYAETDEVWKSAEVRRFLADRLPAYMLPSFLVRMAELPLTPSGKVNRSVLPEPKLTESVGIAEDAVEEKTIVKARTVDAESVAPLVTQAWKKVLGHDDFGTDDPFFEVGGNSILLLQLSNILTDFLGRRVESTFLFQFPSIQSQIKALLGETPARPKSAVTEKSSEVAIIGMYGRFPGADSVPELWDLVLQGKVATTRFTHQELIRAGVSPADLYHPDYVPVRGVLKDALGFDAAFFGISPREAQMTDPQQRVFLEAAWSVLEHAGYTPEKTTARIGVYAGAGFPTYFINELGNESKTGSQHFNAVLGNAADFLATRVGYRLGLNGPCVTLQTACSTSLVAVEAACRALETGSCDIALAGGVSIMFPEKTGYVYEPDSIMSADGVCRPFDAEACGTVNADGVALVALKPLDAALRDGDTVHAVIKGAAVTNDGDGRAGFTAPGVEGQSRAVIQSLQKAGLSGEDIGYVETHGTGTRLGDPIEIAALTKGFGRIDLPDHCALGSIKANLGHLNTAAGVTGLIKAALVVREGRIPVMTNFRRLNPGLSLDKSTFYIPTTTRIWSDPVRRAGVNSLGLGGTNAHVTLENMPVSTRRADEGPQLLRLSAGSEEALRVMTRRLSRFLEVHQEFSLQDIAYTLRAGRRDMKFRCSAACADRASAVEAFRTLTDAPDFIPCKTQPKVAFLFPGLGGRFADMGRNFYNREPVYREVIDDCADFLEARLGGDLRELLYPEPEFADKLAERRHDPRWEMPAVFAVQLATARMARDKGITPSVVLGLSLGEFAAACIAGALSFDEALALVSHRAELSVTHGSGAMLMVGVTPTQAQKLLEKSLEICVTAGPKLTGICGKADDVAELEQRLTEAEIWFRRQDFPLAPHCSMLIEAMQPMRQFADCFGARSPRLPYISSLTGKRVGSGTVLNGDYWSRHLRELSRVQEAMETLLQDPDLVIIDMGPGKGGSAVAQHASNFRKDSRAVSLYPGKPPEDLHLPTLDALGKLWEAGLETDAWFPSSKNLHRVPLPTYPFHHKPYKPEKKREEHHDASANLVLFQRVWDKAPAGPETTSDVRHWYLIADSHGLAFHLEKLLRECGESVTLVWLSASDGQASDHEATIEEWCGEGLPLKIVDLRAYDRPPFASPDQRLQAALDHLHDVTLYLRAVANSLRGVPVEMTIVSSHGTAGVDDDIMRPEQTLNDGPCLVAPQEITFMKTRRIDLGDLLPTEETARELLGELQRPPERPLIALRNGQRRIPVYKPVPHEDEPPRRLRDRGVYVITGGLGGLGLTIAEFLAEKVQARLVLIGRREWPARDQWERMLTEELDDARCMVLKRLVKIEQKGAELLVLSADVTDRTSMTAALQKTRKQWGAVHGVIHAAAAVGLQDLRNIHRAVSARVVRAKVHGTVILDELTRDDSLDMLMLCSSMSGVVGGWGMAVYAATNAFMDAYAVRGHAAGKPILSIGWEGLDMGMTLRASGDQRRREFLLSEVEVKTWFERCLQQAQPHVIMSARGNPESLTRLYLDLGSADDAPAPASLSLRDQVARAWLAELGGDDPKDSDNFFELGGSSLAAIGIVRRLRRGLNESFSVYDLMETRTFGAFLARVKDRHEDHSVNHYRVVFQEGEPGVPPLFLFPPAGGNLLCYMSLHRYLDDRLPVYGIRQRGADGSEPLDRDFESLLDHYTKVVRTLQPEGPYRLAGSSMGGCIAYEVARRLRNEGAEISMVALLDTPGPGEVKTDSLVKDGRFDIEEYLQAMSPDTLARIEALRKEAAEGDPVTGDLGRYHQVFETNLDLMAEFCIYPYEGEVLFLRASERDAWNPDHPEKAWEAMLNGKLQVATVPGNHITMLDEPNVKEVGAQLQKWL